MSRELKRSKFVSDDLICFCFLAFPTHPMRTNEMELVTDFVERYSVPKQVDTDPTHWMINVVKAGPKKVMNGSGCRVQRSCTSMGGT